MTSANFAYTFAHKNLLGVGALNRIDVSMIFERARVHFKANKTQTPALRTLEGKLVLNLFFEHSTRTQASFEIAAKRLGGELVNFAAGLASIAKGESLADTAQVLNAMHPDIFIIRHKAAGAANYFAELTGASVINGGDGAHEHPTQALLDAFTLSERIGDLGGKRICIIGDILHSRVARSNVSLLNLLNADVHLCGPASLLPADADRWGVKVFHALDAALQGCDAVMALRIQKERMHGGLIPSDREFAHFYGINHNRLRQAKPQCVVLHPGPMNRGVEIDSALADDPDCTLILDQVESGIAIRMAILELLSGNAPEMRVSDELGARS